MKVQLIHDQNGDTILPLPDELFLNEQWLEGDEILFTVVEHGKIRMDNLSRLEMSKEEFKENIVCLLARFDDVNDFLKRVVIKENDKKIATLQKLAPKSS